MTNEELVMQYQLSDDYNVLEAIIEQNNGLIRLIASKFYTGKTASIDYDDLCQEGAIGVMVAARKYRFDMENRTKFSSYAALWIKQKIMRFIDNRNTNDEISLNRPAYGDDEEVELLDTITDNEEGMCKVEDSIYYQQLHEEMEQVMHERLSLEQRQIVKFRYGFDCKSCTLGELGEVFNLSVERIRQIEKDSLKKMKNSTWGRRMKKEMNIERKEHLLSPGTRDAHNQYVIFNSNRSTVNDILKRIKSQRQGIAPIQ